MYFYLKKKVNLKSYFLWNSTHTSINTRFKFVPKHYPCCKENLAQIQEFIDNNERLFVLTGAGISTESGIPDYRSDDVGLYATSNRRPVQFKDFVNSPKARKSYWARNFVGWPRFSSFCPNLSHKIIADWESKGKVHCIITQNVDRLHHKAGSRYILELHGSAYQVGCLNCSYMVTRPEFQEELSFYNNYLSLKPGSIRPDGDVALTEEEVRRFHVPNCPDCEGILKPFIVFFGDNVPKTRVEKIKAELCSCDAVLALGTSLSVYSAYRFILLATELRIPIGIINIGETRGDKHALFRIPARCGEVLPLLRVPGPTEGRER